MFRSAAHPHQSTSPHNSPWKSECFPNPLLPFFFFGYSFVLVDFFFKSWNDFLRRSLRRSSFWVTSHLSQNSPGPLSCLVYGSVQALVAMPRVQEWFAVCKWWQIFNILQVDRILLFLWECHVRMQCSQSLLSYTFPQLLLSIPQSLLQLHFAPTSACLKHNRGKSN